MKDSAAKERDVIAFSDGDAVLVTGDETGAQSSAIAEPVVEPGQASVETIERASTRPVAPASSLPPQAGGGFLDDFLAHVEETEGQTVDDKIKDVVEPPKTADELKERVITVLRDIYDPEIPVNIYEMGLIYDVDVREDWSIHIVMTLTSPNCPVAESLPAEVEMRSNAVEGANGVSLELVWDPPWDMSRMSDEARLELGLL